MLHCPASRFRPPASALLLVLFVEYALVALVVLFMSLPCHCGAPFACCFPPFLPARVFSWVLSSFPAVHSFAGICLAPLLLTLSAWVLGLLVQGLCLLDLYRRFMSSACASLSSVPIWILLIRLMLCFKLMWFSVLVVFFMFSCIDFCALASPRLYPLIC